MSFAIPAPDLQIDFALNLAQVRKVYLQDALSETVRDLDIPILDRELAELVAAPSLAILASHGLRGEVLFPVPTILAANPRLIAYYRLLYGFSQKEFYTTATGASVFKSMEERGTINPRRVEELSEFCRSMCKAGAGLLAGISAQRVTSGLLDDLTLLTLGPQFRGGANVRKGVAGIVQVFNVIHNIVNVSIREASPQRIELINAAGRTVLIEFAPDPDIIIREEIRPEVYRNIIAIEVKGGSDFSNIHNRIGEAEKSHQKAKADGYEQCWTVVNVDRIDLAMAKRESPSTNRFYRISDLVTAEGEEFDDFRSRVVSLIGIAG